MPTPEETRHGRDSRLDPCPLGNFPARKRPARFRTRRPQKAEIGNPNREEDPGKPDDKLSERGFRHGLRTDLFLGLQKTACSTPSVVSRHERSSGDYRASGCNACHVIYATTAPSHSGAYAQFGHSGSALRPIDDFRRRVRPSIKHVFTRSIPSSQCMICHIHPGTNMVTPISASLVGQRNRWRQMYPKERAIHRGAALINP